MGVKISELDSLTTADDSNLLPIVDSNSATKKITKENLLKELTNRVVELEKLNNYYARLVYSGTSSTTASSYTTVRFTSFATNQGGFSISNYVVTVPVSGVYAINLNVQFNAVTLGQRSFAELLITDSSLGTIMLRGTDTYYMGSDGTINANHIIALQENATITFRVWTYNSTTLRVLSSSNPGTTAVIKRIGSI